MIQREEEDFVQRASKFLSGTWYAVALTLAVGGLSITVVNRLNDIENRAALAKQTIENTNQRLTDADAAMRHRIEDINIHGSSALAQRVGIIETENRQQGERMLAIEKRIDEIQKVVADVGIIRERMDVNSHKIDRVIELLTGRKEDYPRSPTHP